VQAPVAATGVADNAEEEPGFIGKYSKKIETIE